MSFDEKEAAEFAAARGRTIRYVYLFRKGPAWTAEPSPELDALQSAHLANLRRLADEGKILVNGPFLDALQLGTDVRSFGVLAADSMEQARAWIGSDPMVRAGHLAAEIHAWMIPGGVLP